MPVLPRREGHDRDHVRRLETVEVAAVPGDGVGQRLIEPPLGTPTKRGETVRAHTVPEVVSGPVRDELDQVRRRLGELADAARELEIRQLVTLTDVVHDPGLASVEAVNAPRTQSST